MNTPARYDVTRGDLVKDKAIKYGAWLLPPILAIIPALIFFVVGLLTEGSANKAVYFFFSVLSLVAGFIVGLAISGSLMLYRSRWISRLREQIAADGVRANEIDWFSNELTTTEKKTLKEVKSRNLLLADAYRETLASRLTATRIMGTAARELQLVRKRQNKLKYIKAESSEAFQSELQRDREKLEAIAREAKEMRSEAEMRLEMIDAAARRGTDLSGSDLALKKLTARSEELPAALESAKMEDEIRRELEEDDKVKGI
jgi:hypothetical protein